MSERAPKHVPDPDRGQAPDHDPPEAEGQNPDQNFRGQAPDQNFRGQAPDQNFRGQALGHDFRGRGQAFPSTHWSDVGDVVERMASGRVEELGRLLQRYLPALRAFVARTFAAGPADADDLVQSFVSERILSGDLLARADRARGCFRTFLLQALKTHCMMEHRRRKARRRSPGAPLRSVDRIPEPRSDAPGPDTTFEIEWARATITEALHRMEGYCRAHRMADVWGAFEARIVAAALHGRPPMPYEQLVRTYGFESPSKVGRALITGKRMYKRFLRSVVREYVDSDEAADQEIADLFRIISTGRA